MYIKKLLALFLAALSLFSFASCNKVKDKTGVLEKNIITTADLDHDGKADEITYFYTSDGVTLRVYFADGKTADQNLVTKFSKDNYLFLYSSDEKDYLLRYTPALNGVNGDYEYAAFYYDDGKITVTEHNGAYFTLDGQDELDAAGLTSFAEHYNNLLAFSTLLICKKDDVITIGPAETLNYYEQYDWLNVDENLYNEDDILIQKIRKFSDYLMESALEE